MTHQHDPEHPGHQPRRGRRRACRTQRPDLRRAAASVAAGRSRRGPAELARWLAAVVLASCGPGSPSDTPRACKAQLLPGDLVITEVFADYKAPAGGTGSDDGKEWFEIYNARATAIDLGGLTITHSRPDGSRASSHAIVQATIAPGQFFTLGNVAPEFAPAYLDHGYAADLGDLFNTGGGTLRLACGDDEIDSASYDGVKEGHSRELTGGRAPDYTANDDQASWCQANDDEFEPGNFGTPGTGSSCVPIVTGQCNDGGTMRNAIAPVAGDLVITEVMPSPARVSDATGEWFEAKVISDVDLNGVGLDRIDDTRKPDLITSPDCVRVTAGSYLVFARSREMNGELPAAAIASTFGFSMIPGAPDGAGDIAILAGQTIIDAVTWTRSTSGAALQLDPARTDATANDSESNFCDATMAYGPTPPPVPPPDLGTPGAANAACTALPPPGTCDDNGTRRPIVAPAAGALVISEFLPAPLKTSEERNGNAREWFEIANTGTTAFDLNTLSVAIGTSRETVQSAKCLPVAPAGFAVFAHSNIAASNGLPGPVAATFARTLNNSDGSIEIADGTTVLDRVAWSTVTAGATRQVDPGRLNTTDNDDASTTSYCNGTNVYGDPAIPNKGTPGEANRTCP